MARITVNVNGEDREIDGAPVHTNLLDWLRSLGLTGAKEGCAEGECGACAVLVARPDGEDRTRWTSVNACLPPALAFDGQEIVTSEGLGTAEGACAVEDLHPVQREMADRGGSQCGYCTPGFICSMAAEYYRPERTGAPADAEVNLAAGSDGTDGSVGTVTGSTPAGATTVVETAAVPADTSDAHAHETGPNGFDIHSLSGNLCRCTGYRPIRDAAYALGSPESEDPLAQRLDAAGPAARATAYAAGEAEFHRPATLTDLLDRLAEQPDAQIVAGATDVGVELNLRHTRPPVLLAVDRLAELRDLTRTPDHVEIGAALTLSEVERELDGEIPVLAELFPLFASRLIRNGATFGGNLGTGSPIGDAPPALLALGASLVLASRGGERVVDLAEYFTGYRQTVREPGEIIKAVRIPLSLAPTTAFYKIAKRRFDDISSVAVAIAARIEDGLVSDIRIGVGGIAATPVRALATEDALRGRPWSEETVSAAAQVMSGEGTPMDDHRASSRYRSAMLGQALCRFYVENSPSEVLEVAR
ncbi:xanthine dehydrogenase small subunit [Georgenia sp. Z1491]|uniref:xanthine dehydrogenase small subunit n=1 Tax=Georgenia sp. Z1491 TaxID=3416707 RepID=UPI003CEE5281